MAEKNSSSSEKSDSSFDATMAFEAVEKTTGNVRKHELDLAVAVVVVSGNRLSERQLSRVTRTWTVHGSETLGQLLVSKGLITAADEKRISAHAQSRLRRLGDNGSETKISKEAGTSTLATQVNRLRQIDSGGRLIKLLGLSHDETHLQGETRKLDSRFTLVRRLGEGGLGIVWLARDENLNRYVAIKEIRASNPGAANVLSRFKREAELTGRLEHPGIVPIYQFGKDPERQSYFYVMRFLGKHTMQDAIAEYHERREAGMNEPLLLHRLLTAFVNLCQSVAHAHSKKIVHRDLKPENVALDAFGQVILLDWGLAKVNDEFGLSDSSFENLSDTAPQDSNLTMANQVLGSPMYMAPEQAAGRLDEIDEQTDVYGLGGILYGILTGHAPHENSFADPSSGATIPDILSTIVSRPVSSPSELVPDVPSALEAICLKATSQKKYARYSSAAAIAEDVERYLAGGQVIAYQEPFTKRTVRWATAHPRVSQLLGALAAFMFALVFIGIYSLRQRQLAEHNMRFSHATDTAKEIGFHLESKAELAASNVRFITGLPPIQGIVDARSGVAKESDSEATWIDRLGTIFDGLIRNNQSYLSIVYFEVEDNIIELCRSERNIQTGWVRRVPDAALVSFPIPEAEPPLDSLKPGDVVLKTSDRIAEHAPLDFRHALSIAASAVTYDQHTGELFGFAAAQVDLEELVKERMASIGGEGVNIYLTDHLGIVQLAFESGELETASVSSHISEVIPGLKNFESMAAEELTDGTSYFATRLTLGSAVAQSSAIVGVIAQVAH